MAAPLTAIIPHNAHVVRQSRDLRALLNALPHCTRSGGVLNTGSLGAQDAQELANATECTINDITSSLKAIGALLFYAAQCDDGYDEYVAGAGSAVQLLSTLLEQCVEVQGACTPEG